MTIFVSYLIALMCIYIVIATFRMTNHQTALKPIPIESNERKRAHIRD